jgi:hypothetical protein
MAEADLRATPEVADLPGRPWGEYLRPLGVAVLCLWLVYWAFSGVRANVPELIQGAPQMAETLGRMLPPDLTRVTDPAVYDKPGYDPLKSFAPVAYVARVPNLLVVNAASPAKDFKDFIARAKAQPGKLNYASGGSGVTNHLATESFKLAAARGWTHDVPEHLRRALRAMDADLDGWQRGNSPLRAHPPMTADEAFRAVVRILRALVDSLVRTDQPREAARVLQTDIDRIHASDALRNLTTALGKKVKAGSVEA